MKGRTRIAIAVAVLSMAVVGCSTAQPGQPATSPAALTAGTTAPAATVTADTADAVCEQAAERTGGYVRQWCTVDAPSLANNLIGDPAALKATILLPDGYESAATAYPVIYVLAGWGDSGESLAADMLRNLPAGSTGHRSILVFAGGTNGLGGSFYANSSVTGNWADAIATDLVAFVDSHFRTVPEPAARGIAGHSMGGAGALNVGMSRPDVFGAIYAISPGVFDADGFAARLGGTSDEIVLEEVAGTGGKLAALPASERGTALADAVSGRRSDVRFAFAYGAAFAPDPEHPLLIDWPYVLENGKAVRNQAAYERWEAGFGGLTAKVEKYAAGLKALRGFAIEYGTTVDEPAWIQTGCHHFVTLLSAAGIPVVENTFEGGHSDHIGDRLANAMLPYMEAKLASS
jgi:pimeloyl-ACP methyl ester carboxylesterase